jgi:hypothetical protein
VCTFGLIPSLSGMVCGHKAFDYCIYDRGKISSPFSQSVMSIITNGMWDLTFQLVHTSLTEWNTSTIIISTMMLGLVNDGKYWIDALHDKVISLLKDTLQGGYILSCCDRIDIEWPCALMQMGQVRFNKSHAICSTSIVCKFVVEGEVFVKKEEINDEFVSEGEDSDVAKIEDELVSEAEESDCVKEERIKTVVNLNGWGVSDFLKP